MRIAFYAPLKSADHPSKSGDRRMARSFLRLLAELGHDVRTACHLRSFDRYGDRSRQQRIAGLGRRCADRLQQRFDRADAWRPELWFTYHAYHKAPDYIGPKLSAATAIPYIVAEASIAGKQEQGRWQLGHETALRSARQADALIAMTAVDEWNLHRWVDDKRRVHRLAPFVDVEFFAQHRKSREQYRKTLSDQFALKPNSIWLVTAAIMRDDVKKQSYLALIEALAQVRAGGWQILVIGDGPARKRIEPGFSALGGDRAVLAGEIAEQELAQMLAACDLYVWPAFNEAYGMAILEAQAAGLPVVACREGGVPDIVADGQTGDLIPERSSSAFAKAVSDLLGDHERRHRLGENAARRAVGEHDWPIARLRLGRIIDSAIATSRAQ